MKLSFKTFIFLSVVTTYVCGLRLPTQNTTTMMKTITSTRKGSTTSRSRHLQSAGCTIDIQPYGSVITGYDGDSVSISDDGQVIATGEPPAVLEYDSFSDFYFERASGIFPDGTTVFTAQALSSDGNEFAAIFTSEGEFVSVVRFNGSSWSSLGGPVLSSVTASIELELSADGTILAVSVNNVARIFQYQPTSQSQPWVQLGNDIPGSASGLENLSLSDDGLTVAFVDGSASVFVYTYNGSQWTQLGGTLTGGADFGHAVALSGNGLRIAISEASYEVPPPPGEVRVYEISGSSWNLVNNQFIVGNDGENAGSSVALSFDGSVLIVGANGGPGRVDIWADYFNTWEYLDTITVDHGGTGRSRFGSAVSVTADATYLAANSLFDGAAVYVYSMNVTCPPLNDDCFYSQSVSIDETISADTSTATFPRDDLDIPSESSCSKDGAGIWYTVSGTGRNITAETCNSASSLDTVISVFEGNQGGFDGGYDCSNLICIGDNDDGCDDSGSSLLSSFTWESALGVDYFIFVHGFGGEVGPFQLDIDSPALPTVNPTKSPTLNPTKNPTTKSPTVNPTISPTRSPVVNPTTANPTKSPTLNPTKSPAANPTTVEPTRRPTLNPTPSPMQPNNPVGCAGPDEIVGEGVVLDQCISTSFEPISSSGIRTASVFFTTSSGTDNDLAVLDEDGNGQNDFAQLVLQWVEETWTILRQSGFSDPLGLTNFRVLIHLQADDTFRSSCCQDNRSMAVDPIVLQLNENFMHGSTVHQFFHAVLFSETHGDWFNEGLASWAAYHVRAALFSITRASFYVNEIDELFALEYEQSLLTQSYVASLFWTYISEQLSISSGGNNPTSADMLEAMGFFLPSNPTSVNILQRMESFLGLPIQTIFSNYGTANYVHWLSSYPAVSASEANAFQYTDSTRLQVETGQSYPRIRPTLDASLDQGQSLPYEQISMPSWSNRYFRIRPTTTVNVLNFSFLQTSGYSATYTVLAIKNNDLILYRRIQSNDNFNDDLNERLENIEYDEIVVIVSSHAQDIEFRYAFSAIDSILTIVAPIVPVFVGDPTAPKLTITKIAFTDLIPGTLEPVGRQPESIEASDVLITVGSQIVPTSNIITISFVLDAFWIVFRPPTQSSTVGGELLDLEVTVGESSDTNEKVVRYGSLSASDNVVVIDRSASMDTNERLEAAQTAARVFIDSYKSGDQIGVVSFNEIATVNAALASYASGRLNALTQIGLVTAAGTTSIGAALLAALNQLDQRGVHDHEWNIVLLSDGQNVDNPPISEFEAAWISRRDGGGQCSPSSTAGCLPRVHTVAIGSREIDRQDLQNLSDLTDGLFFFVPDIPIDDTVSLRRLTNHNAETTFELELTKIYRNINEEIEDMTNIFSVTKILPCLNNVDLDEHSISIASGTSEAIFVFVWNQGEIATPTVVLTDPNSVTINPDETFGNHVVWKISNPASGNWLMAVAGDNSFCDSGLFFLIDVSASVDVLFSVEVRQEDVTAEGTAPVNVAAILTDGNGPLQNPVVTASVELPDGSFQTVTMRDDGNSNDGEAGDGIFGAQIADAANDEVVGNIAVQADATGQSTSVGSFETSTNVAAAVVRPTDSDNDGIPDSWEDRFRTCGLNKDDPSDASEDFDGDGLTNLVESRRGTHPCKSDTDGGGEADGSEINAGNDPGSSIDDAVPCLTKFVVENRIFDRGSAIHCRNARAAILEYTPDSSYRRIEISRALSRNGAYSLLNNDRDRDPIVFTTINGRFRDERVTLGQQYCYKIQGVIADGRRSCLLGPACTIPSDNPLCLQSFLINGGEEETLSAAVVVSVRATGVSRMKLSSNPSGEDKEWEPFRDTWDFTLDTNDGAASGPKTIHAQFEGNDGTTGTTSAQIVYRSGNGSPTSAPISPIIDDDDVCEFISPGNRCDLLGILPLYSMNLNLFGGLCIPICVLSTFQFLFNILGFGCGGCG